MTINLTLPPVLEQEVRSAAELRQLSVETYVLSLVESAVSRIKAAPGAVETHEEFVAAMRRLGEIPTPDSLVEETWSRATIYGEHD